MDKGLALHWRLIPQRYNLIGSECRTCGEKYFPMRDLCPKCRRKGRLEDYPFSGEGEVYSYTVVHAPPLGFEYLKPYIAAIIKLKEGPLITAQIADCRPEDVRIGDKVRMAFRKIIAEGEEGIIKYGYKFKQVK